MNRRDWLRKIVRVLVIVVGLGILIYPSLSQYLSHENSSRAVASYNSSVADMRRERREAMLAAAEDYNRLLTSAEPLLADGGSFDASAYWGALDVDGNGMMGSVRIPRLSTELPIYHGTSEAVPVGGEGTHAVLSGHRGLPTASLLTDLGRMEAGDAFYIKVLNQTLAYEVDQIVTVEPHEVEELAIAPGRDYVTLVTCTPYGINSHRLLVRGHRVPYTEATEAVALSQQQSQPQNPWFQSLPIQYRHMLIGVAVVAVLLLLRGFVLLLVRWRARKALEARVRSKLRVYKAAVPISHAKKQGFEKKSVYRGKKRVYRVGTLLLAAALLFGLPTAARAAVPSSPGEGEATGELNIVCIIDDAGETIPLAGDTYQAFHVADASVVEGADWKYIRYETCETLGAYTCDWVNMTDAELSAKAQELAQVMKTHPGECSGTEITDQDGRATFSDLPLGLYLVVRTQVAPDNGPYEMDPFLAGAQWVEEDVVTPSITAVPKFAMTMRWDEEDDLPEPPIITPGRPAPAPGGQTLPQTGQLKWPVPVLLAVSFVFFAAGAVLQRAQRRRRHEN